MDCCRRTRKRIIIFLFLICVFPVYANKQPFYNLLVEDLLNSCIYGYKGMNLETREIDFTNSENIVSSSDTTFYIQSEMGFFRVRDSNNDVFYTRNGEFEKYGNEYYLAYSNYKLDTKIEDCNNDSCNKKTLIYHPTKTSVIIRDNYLFSFSDVECFEEEIIPNRLELPNTDPIQILLKMKTILLETSGQYYVQLEIIDRMLDVLINDKMHEYYIIRNISQFDLEKYQLLNNQTNIEQLTFIFSTNWVRTFRKYIIMLYI